MESKWKAAKAEFETKGDGYQGQLGKLELDHVVFVNRKLREYDALTDRFGAFVHMYDFHYLQSIHNEWMTLILWL